MFKDNKYNLKEAKVNNKWDEFLERSGNPNGKKNCSRVMKKLLQMEEKAHPNGGNISSNWI